MLMNKPSAGGENNNLELSYTWYTQEEAAAGMKSKNAHNKKIAVL